jgi:hypothetical protein
VCSCAARHTPLPLLLLPARWHAPQFRFTLLALAGLEVPLQLPLGEKGLFGEDCVFIANDWCVVVAVLRRAMPHCCTAGCSGVARCLRLGCKRARCKPRLCVLVLSLCVRAPQARVDGARVPGRQVPAARRVQKRAQRDGNPQPQAPGRVPAHHL